jgi:hypothetical protein
MVRQSTVFVKLDVTDIGRLGAQQMATDAYRRQLVNFLGG